MSTFGLVFCTVLITCITIYIVGWLMRRLKNKIELPKADILVVGSIVAKGFIDAGNDGGKIVAKANHIDYDISNAVIITGDVTCENMEANGNTIIATGYIYAKCKRNK